MKSVVVLCLLAAVATAAPRFSRKTRLDPALSERVRAAEAAWTAAEREPDAAKQPALWESAAGAFAAVDGDAIDTGAKRDAAFAAVQAWRNALDANLGDRTKAHDLDSTAVRPRAVKEREQKAIAAFDRFVTRAGPADLEVPTVLYVKASVLASFDQLDAAIAIYRTIIQGYPKHEVAGYSAMLMLDAYNRLAKYDALIAAADELAKNATLLEGRDDLAAIVKTIQRRGTRMRAELTEKRAKETRDLDTYVACGHLYLGIYSADPGARDGDEALYNAGVCFEDGAAMTAALQAFGLIMKGYPNSKLSARALARSAMIYAHIAMYDRAAELLERYAKKYAGEKDAYDALSDAVYYRKAIGDRAAAIEDTKYFVKTFGAKRPREAAAAMFSLTALYEGDPDQLVKHLREYLAVFGSKGGDEQVVIAHAKLGMALWKQSCKVRGVDGLCVTANERAPRTCGTGTVRTFTVVKRDEKKIREALVEFQAASKVFSTRQVADAGARYYYAQGKLVEADLELEKFLAMAFPANLDFGAESPDRRSASMKRFDEWMGAKTRLGGQATNKYEAVLAIKDAASAITAAERLGIVSELFASSLVTGVIPRDIARGAFAAEAKSAYCDAMAGAAEPLEARSVDAYGVCLAKSTELSWFDDSSRFCEQTLIRLRPEDYPPLRERRGSPHGFTGVNASEPPVRGD